MKTLWMASWYPNKISPFNGDFIKRHAEAVSLYTDIHVIHLVKDEKGDMTKDVLVEENHTGRLSETIIYYHVPGSLFSIANKFYSAQKFSRLYKQAIKKYVNANGVPAIVHVHVGMKAGLAALWMKRKWRTAFVVSEHWSGFLPEATDKFAHQSPVIRYGWKRTMKEAAGCSAVSASLAKGLATHFPMLQCRVIPNVVNKSIFFPAHVDPGFPQFIHISGLDELKNPVEILQAFQMLKKDIPAARLAVFGSVKQEIVNKAAALGLADAVSFHPEVAQSVLAEQMNKSAALILYSSYETFGCVIIEANACGVPVIASDIPVFHETVADTVNGYFVPLHQPGLLAEKMKMVLRQQNVIDRHTMAETTVSKYSYETIGKMFSDWYKEIINRS